jgi:hypothetical protein
MIDTLIHYDIIKDMDITQLTHDEIMSVYRQIQSYLAKKRWGEKSEQEKSEQALKAWETRRKNSI